MTLGFKNGTVLLPDGTLAKRDVAIAQGRIAAVGEGVADGLEAIEVPEGWVVLPGAIDPQVHFREPGLEHKEDLTSASRACAKGGVTAFLEMPNTRPLTTTQATLDDKLARAARSCVVNYGFFIGATPELLPDLDTAGPTCGIKVFMGSMHGPLLMSDGAVLDRLFARGDRLIAVHAEDQARMEARRQLYAGCSDPAVHSLIQDNQAALTATQLAVGLAQKYQRRLHILHLSTADEALWLRTHKTPYISCEVTPQHLLLDITAYETLGTLAQMNPPLRTPADRRVLWQALRDGVIDCIATDHAPHTLAEKAQPYPQSPSGMPGVETELPLLLTAAQTGECTIAQVSRWMSENVARLYQIPNKGRIAPGWDADLVVVNLREYRPVVRSELLTKCGWSPFEGWNLTGWPEITVVNGQIAYRDRRVHPEPLGQPLRFDPNFWQAV